VNQRPPTFSVIVPVYHGGWFLRDALASLVALDYPADQLEVIVAGPADDAGAQRITEEAATLAPPDCPHAGGTRRSGLHQHKADEGNLRCTHPSHG